MSTIAYRASLIRKIEEVIKQINDRLIPYDREHAAKEQGQLDAYAHILSLIKEDDL